MAGPRITRSTVCWTAWTAQWRATGPSDLGGHLDIVADFAFYVSVPVGFGISDPANALAALVLVASFVLTGTSFLAFAVVAAKRGHETVSHGAKSRSALAARTFSRQAAR